MRNNGKRHQLNIIIDGDGHYKFQERICLIYSHSLKIFSRNDGDDDLIGEESNYDTPEISAEQTANQEIEKRQDFRREGHYCEDDQIQ